MTAKVRNTMKLVKKSVGAINGRYDMCIENIQEIKDNSQDDIELICNGFRFGYMQGMKAAQAEFRQGN